MKKSDRVLTLFLCIVTGCASVFAQDLESAKKLESDGKTTDAIRTYAAWLQSNRDHSDYVRILVHTAELQTDVSAALKLLSGSLETQPAGAGRNEVLKVLAGLEEMSGRFSDAQKHYEEASYAEPGRKDYGSLLASAELLFALGDIDGAEVRSRAVLLTCDDAALQRNATVLYARIYSATGQFAQGIETLEKVRRSAPGGETAPMLLLLGWLYTKNGQDGGPVFELLKTRFAASPEAGLIPGTETAGVQLFPEPSLLFEFTGTGEGVATAGGQKKVTAPLVSGETQGAPGGSQSALQPAGTGSSGTGTAGQSEAAVSPAAVRTGDTGIAVQPGTAPAGTKEKQSVQTGSYTKRENAEDMAGRLRKTGFDARLQVVTLRGTTYYRVLIPVPGSVEDARRVMMNLKEKGIESFLVFD